MNIPLRWLSEYVKLPQDISVLTDRLTMIGHMLDKRFQVQGEDVIDLELRGNRADLFGLIGVARDIAVAFQTELSLPQISELPKAHTRRLVQVDAPELVERFAALTLSVTMQPSPEFIVQRLNAYGIPSINTVVDITNYVMIESGEPMHAYDLHALAGKRLILRRAGKKEQCTTLSGAVVSLTPDDLVIADERSVQGLTMIGGDASKVTNTTTEILLEAAVYHQGNVRRTARRLGIRTEAGNRHEKHLDPHGVTWAVQRALYLLKTYANATVTSGFSDYFPNKKTAAPILFHPNDVLRLTSLDIPVKKQTEILTALGCTVIQEKQHLVVTVPTFRTDLDESADLVEEIARIIGYQEIKPRTLSGVIPPDQTLPSIIQEDNLKQLFVQLQLNEVITNSFIRNTWLNQYSIQGEFNSAITVQNAPDTQVATLRPTLLFTLLEYAKHSLEHRAARVAIFEIGNTYSKTQPKKSQKAISEKYTETRTAAILMTGSISTESYNKHKRKMSYEDLKGILEVFGESLGYDIVCRQPEESHPLLDQNIQAAICIGTETIGTIGKIETQITKEWGIDQPVFYAEILLDRLLAQTIRTVKPYRIAKLYPPAIEDLSLRTPETVALGEMITFIRSLDPIIVNASLLDIYQDKRTIRITYQHPEKTLSADDIRPIREKILKTLEKDYQIKLVEA